MVINIRLFSLLYSMCLITPGMLQALHGFSTDKKMNQVTNSAETCARQLHSLSHLILTRTLQNFVTYLLCIGAELDPRGHKYK